MTCCQDVMNVKLVGFVDAAMELALSLEKLTNEKLLNLHSVMNLTLYAYCYK